jgi:CheY-like chemotaxis protein
MIEKTFNKEDRDFRSLWYPHLEGVRPSFRRSGVIHLLQTKRTRGKMMEGPSSRSLDLLIVDDDFFVREVIKGNLAERFPTFLFREADSGNAALTLVNEKAPDIVLVDLRMPGLNGFALIRLLHKRDRTRHIPIVAISGLRDSASIRKAVEAGVTDYCAKPIDFEQLGAKIDRIVKNVLKRTDVTSRQRNAPRKTAVGSISVVLPVCYPERDGVWINSPLEMEEGDPIMFYGKKFFRALRLDLDNPFAWSRVEHCHREEDLFRVKLLFEEIPEDYQKQLAILNRSNERMRRYVGQASASVTLDFPCEVKDLSGEGLRMIGTLPWREGVEVNLDISDVIETLSIAASDPVIRACIRWSETDGPNRIAGVHFVDLEDELRRQLMAWCLGTRIEEGY